MKSGYAPVNGLHLYYESHGEGAPLVLIHGGGSTIESNFGRVIPRLAATRHVIAVEEQGHGHTAAIARPFTFENSADDVAGLLDYLKIERADVFGFSNGGTIAMRVAQRHARKVRRLIVASANTRRDGMIAGFWEGMAKGTLASMPQALKDADAQINPDPRHLEQLFKQDSERMLGFEDWDDRDVAAITAPTLFLVADQDVVTVEHVLAMSRAVRGARLAVFPANHGNYLGEVCTYEPQSGLPALTVSLINEFLA